MSHLSIPGRLASILALLPVVLALSGVSAERAAAAPCDPPIVNQIVCENSKAGNPPSEWDVSGAGDSSIQGFATDISVDQGQTVRFKISTPSSKYRLDIYRMGYYGGNGARRVASVKPSVSLPQSQPACLSQSATGLIDCGNWAQSASWAVPADAVSGIYFAKLVREDTSSGGSHIIFVVRDDDGHSDLLFQTSDTTWQAYNRYGGNSLYEGGPGTNPGRAYKVSYNRPLTVRGTSSEDSPFNAEYPMVRWLERNGYDVSYSTGIDTDRRGAELLEHRAFLSVGHDEYWSGTQRANVEAARAAGVNLAFFSGNESFWKTRWENSIDASGTDHRTLVCYKETHANAKIDPQANVWTGTWRDPRFSPPADGGRPENSLSGTIFMVNSGTTAIRVPAADGKLRLWRETSVASLSPGQTATLAANTLGYEWDEEVDNGSRPAGLIDLSSTTASVSEKLLDQGSTYGPGTATHHLTLYRAPSGALVFGAGTIQWSWGLDGTHDRGGSTADARMQQATVNLLADMGVQPRTLQSGLAAASQTTDTRAPTTTITNPPDGSQVTGGTAITISGTSIDPAGETAGGQVGGVEVSVDGGSTWHPATGRGNWTYSWTPGVGGSVTIKARATDDSGNIESPPAQVVVNSTGPSCPCSIWDNSFTGPQDPDTSATEIGTKFRSDVPGFITGLRFYKTSGNTGTHIGRLWTAGGTQLAQATFSGESATGWQNVSFSAPVAINANTTYIASYHAPNGHYSSISGYFAVVGKDSPPLHALADGVDGANGIYKYGASGSLFSAGGPNTYNSEGYLIDVAFNPSGGADTNPPVIVSRAPAPGANDVSSSSNVTATFNEAMDPATVNGSTVSLSSPGGVPVAATVSYSTGQQTVTLDPASSLQDATTYTATIKGGPGGVADQAGNRLAGDSAWSFSTAAPPPPPPDEGPGGPILVISNSANAFSRYYAEILRAEGLNEFTVTDLANVNSTLLGAYDVAILGQTSLTAAQVTTLSNWVQGGGNLIAMRPAAQLAGLLGLSGTPSPLENGYLKVDTGTAAGAGVVGQTIQFHGTADRYTTAGAQTIATLFSNASTATSSPAVTLRSVGSNGGQAAAFTYDLARSIVYTRQGNPAWSGQERDGTSPIRSDDLFFGAKQGDVQPDWVDLSKVAIPQADEQQHLLKNLIEEVNLDRKPLPSFWFLPRDEKAAVVMTGDDHGNGGTAGRFDKYIADSPRGCVVADWECVRATSYIFPSTPLSSSAAVAYQNAGFEIGLHLLTNCNNWADRDALESFYSSQLEDLGSEFPGLNAPVTNRTHCITWSDWATQPKVELQNGIRLDANYYYWPPEWVQNRPGLFTGSGMPMRFADLDGSMIDVYQAATQMTDESGQAFPFTIDTLLDRALGPEGYYGVFTANMHTDDVSSSGSDAIVASARARGVPIVSARQMLTWLDGRNNSSFGAVKWNGTKLQFTIDHAPGANGLRAMVPVTSAVGALTGVKLNGSAVATTTRPVKGRDYAFFDAAPGSYEASYAVDETPPVISNVGHSVSNDGTATVTWETDEASSSRVDFGTQPGTLTASQGSSTAATSHSVQLTGLSPSTTYYYRVNSADPAGNSSTAPAPPAPPREFTTPAKLLTDTAVADFAAGTADASTRIAQTADGEVILKPTEGDEFSAGPGLPAAWASCPWTAPENCASGTGATVSSGSLRLDGNYARTVASYGSGRSLEFAASFGGQNFEHAGFGVDLNNSPNWAIFSIGSSGSLSARTNANGATTETPLSSSLVGSPHRYRIDWGPSDVRYYVDGALVTTHAADFAGTQMRPIASDFTPGAPELSLDWLRMSPYAGQATFLSRVFDAGAGQTAGWGAMTWNASTPAGTAVGLSVRTGNTPIPDGTWSGFTPIAASGGDIPGSSRYIQYRAQLTTSEPAATPTLDDVSIAYSAAVETAPETTIDSGPSGPTNDSTPTFAFHSSVANSTFTCSIDTGAPSYGPCSGPGATHTPSAPLADGSYTFRVRAADAEQQTDPTPATSSFTVDTQAPGPPSLSGTAPASPANSNVPRVLGSTEAGAQVRIYTSPDCSGAPLAVGSAAELAGLGITAAVPDNSTVLLRATATDAATNTSACSAPVTYIEDSAAPETQIDTGPSGTIVTATASFAFSSEPGASFQCSLDGAGFSSCSSPQAYSSLSDGPHIFAVRAVDQAGNVDPTPASRSFSVDLRAPDTTIASGPSGPTNDSTPTFGFSSSESGSTFECRFDSAAFAPCSGPGETHTPSTPLADGVHSFEVRAVDVVANPDPSPASRSFSIDTEAPAAPSLTSTSPSSPANANSPRVLGGAEPGSSVSIYPTAGCSGAPLASGTAADLASPGIAVSVLDNSTTTLRAIATDVAGNSSACSAALVYVEDSAPPDTSITSGPSGPTNDSTPTFGFSSSESGSTFECRFDSAAFAPCSGPGATHTPTSALAGGAHTFSVRAVDQARNVDSSPATRSFSIDAQAPNTTIASGPSGPTNDSTPTFGFSSSESGSTFECRFDSAAFAPCSGPAASHTPTIALAEGAHTFEVRAVDAAGNVDPTPAARSFSVDAQAPNTTITSGPSGATTNRKPSFAFTSSESGSTFQCRLDSSNFAACSSPKTYSTQPFGTHTFQVRATDSAGNVDPTPDSRTFTIQR